MRRLTVLLLGLTAAPAAAQLPYQNPYGNGGFGGGYGPVANPGAFAPNFYNRQTQPLSPYLNLFRNNPAVNYYYGTRPGTIGGGMGGPMGFNQMYNPLFYPQMQYLPQAATVLDTGGESIEPGGREVTLRPAGHPVIYGNTFNMHGSYYSVYAQAINRGQGGRSGQRGGTGGTGMPQGASGLGAVNQRPSGSAPGARR